MIFWAKGILNIKRKKSIRYNHKKIAMGIIGYKWVSKDKKYEIKITTFIHL